MQDWQKTDYPAFGEANQKRRSKYSYEVQSRCAKRLQLWN